MFTIQTIDLILIDIFIRILYNFASIFSILIFVVVDFTYNNIIYQTRCEVILHTHPDLPIANELHLACIESIEEQQRETLKKDTVNNIKAAGAGFMGMTNAMLKPPSSLTKNIQKKTTGQKKCKYYIRHTIQR